MQARRCQAVASARRGSRRRREPDGRASLRGAILARSAGWATGVEDQPDPAGSSLGGKLHGFWYAFGNHDGYNLWEAPDNVSMAAVALAIALGSCLSVQTRDRRAIGSFGDGRAKSGPNQGDRRRLQRLRPLDGRSKTASLQPLPDLKRRGRDSNPRHALKT